MYKRQDETIRGDRATLVGLMTESDEESVSQAEASLQNAAGQHTFNVIRASIGDGESRSVVTSFAAPSDYTLHEVDTVLDLASRTKDAGKTRVIQMPAGTRPGFLCAVADAMHGEAAQWRASRQVTPGEPIAYAYHGKIYQLWATRTRALDAVRVGSATYEHVIASDFQIKNMQSGELTEFSMTFAADGQLAEIPLLVTYQPRWWLQVQLTLDDKTPGPLLARVGP